MAELSFHYPGKLFFGSDVLNLLSSLVFPIGNRTMLITDSVLHEARYISRIQDILRKKGIDCILLDDVVTPGTRRTVQEVTEFARASRIQVVIGLGGTSVLNIARKVACLATGNTTREGLPIPLSYIEIPSVFRNPYMISNAYVDTDPLSRRPVLAHCAEDFPKAVLMDPSISSGLSPKFMGTLMLDTLLMAIEGYLSSNENFFSNSQFLTAIELLSQGIGEAIRGVKDLRPRVKASQAGILCAFGIRTTGIGVGSILSLAVSTLFGAPKSWAAAILLPHMLDYLAENRTERMAVIARLMGEDVYGLDTGAAAELVPTWARRTIAQMCLPGRLRDLDLKLSELIDAAEAAAEFDPASRVSLTIDGLYDILKRAY